MTSPPLPQAPQLPPELQPELPPDRLVGLPPVLSAETRLLVLGSFPGAASLRAGQYYAHPRNHFWPILGALWGLDLVALPYPQRLDLMLRRGLGLWDIYASCERQGSLDQDIRHARANDLAGLHRLAPALRGVAHNGAESARARAEVAAQGWTVHRLPSTSPANAGWSFERKLQAWRDVLAGFGLA